MLDNIIICLYKYVDLASKFLIKMHARQEPPSYRFTSTPLPGHNFTIITELEHSCGSNCPCTIKSSCYKSLIIPILEFSSTVWDPHTVRYINKLEIEQRWSTRYVSSDYCQTGSPTEMVSTLGWESLAKRC